MVAHHAILKLGEASGEFMNALHHRLCRSLAWKNRLASELLPCALKDVELGTHALEIGPGFGLMTDILRHSVEHLTCVEIDRQLASSLARRMDGGNVTVLCEDASATSLKDGTFDSVLCFTMLHHVPSMRLQDRVLSEATRVLRPGGFLVGTDSVASWRMSLLHIFDTMNLIDPASFPHRLHSVGLVDVQVQVSDFAFLFRARKPTSNGQQVGALEA